MKNRVNRSTAGTDRRTNRDAACRAFFGIRSCCPCVPTTNGDAGAGSRRDTDTPVGAAHAAMLVRAKPSRWAAGGGFFLSAGATRNFRPLHHMHGTPLHHTSHGTVLKSDILVFSVCSQTAQIAAGARGFSSPWSVVPCSLCGWSKMRTTVRCRQKRPGTRASHSFV